MNMQALASCKVLIETLEHVDGEGIPLKETHLAGELLELLHSLQPLDKNNVGRSLSSQQLLHSLRGILGQNILPPGEEHCAAEALDLLMQTLTSELTSAFHSHAQTKLQARSALNTLLAPIYSALADVELQHWHNIRLPCEGLLSSYMQCVRCRHMFTTQYTPFNTLSMPLTVSPKMSALGVAHVKPGSSLVPCFDAIFGFELVHGVECPGCTIRESLKTVDLSKFKRLIAQQSASPTSPRSLPQSPTSSPRTASSAPQSPRKSFERPQVATVQAVSAEEVALAELWQAVDDHRSLPHERAITELFKATKIEYVHQKSTVTRRSVVSRWPKLLILHLRRTFWTDEGQHVKVVGKIRFPMRLALDAKDAQKVGYRLVSVVEHSGLSAGTGHYVTYRAVGPAEPPQQNGKGGGGVAQHAQQRWVRVSDEHVAEVSEAQVMEVEACILFYQKDKEHEAAVFGQADSTASASAAAAGTSPTGSTGGSAANSPRARAAATTVASPKKNKGLKAGFLR